MYHRGYQNFAVLAILCIFAAGSFESAIALKCYQCVSTSVEACKSNVKSLDTLECPVTPEITTTPQVTTEETVTTTPLVTTTETVTTTPPVTTTETVTTTPRVTTTAETVTTTPKVTATAETVTTTPQVPAVTNIDVNEGGEESGRWRRSLLDRFKVQPRDAEEASETFCFKEVFLVDEKETVNRGCTSDKNYCDKGVKKESCAICSEDGCNTGASLAAYGSIIFSVLAIVLIAK